jgi:hypothetical protein
MAHIDPIRATATEERQIDSQQFTIRKQGRRDSSACVAG